MLRERKALDLKPDVFYFPFDIMVCSVNLGQFSEWVCGCIISHSYNMEIMPVLITSQSYWEALIRCKKIFRDSQTSGNLANHPIAWESFLRPCPQKSHL